ncbi:MAG TPA: hypothetical protein VIT88_12615 [Pyrinomonadaceae bacterium]
MSAQVDLWRVQTAEGAFEADLPTLKLWIAEGAVLPTDKVSKGSLNWIDAGRAPMLRGAFNGERPAPVAVVAEPASTQEHYTPVENQEPVSAPPSFVQAPTVPIGNACQVHPANPPAHLCSGCGALLCAECPRVVSRIPLCPLCGELCKSYEEVKTRTANREFQASGFGMTDFTRALSYPFQHKVALAFGALLYASLLLLGWRAGVIGYVILFGCMSHVISQVAWGRLDRSFMPDFSEFSVVDDLVQPICLGLGITIVTWGPTIVLLLALLFGVMQAAPDATTFAPADTESAQVSEAPTTDDLAVLTDPNADPKALEEANKKLNQTRPGAQISREAERSQDEMNDPTAGISMLLPYLGAGMAIMLLLLVCLIWAIFYYPMALAVAGYTQSFASVINPLVGLDTIKRMGSTYFKAFGMVLLIQVVGFGVSVVVAAITSPFSLPFIGNLPAMFINGTVTFYFSLVVACLLGLSLYKCADQLGISVD